MTVQHNGTALPTATIPPDAPASMSRARQHLAGQLAAVVNAAGDLQLDDSNTLVAVARQNVAFNDGGGVAFIAGEDFHLTNGGCAGIVAGRDFTLRNGGCGFVLAGRDVSFANGEGAISVAGQRITAAGHQSAIIAARDVELHQSKAGVVIAGNVTLDGSATVVVEVTPERVAGALVGLIFYLPVRLLQKLQGN
jgi:hypothetical protein